MSIKKPLIFLLCLCLIGAFPIATDVNAASSPVPVSTWDELKQAVEQASDDVEIVLVNDIDLEGTLQVNTHEITINSSGSAMTLSSYQDNRHFDVSGSAAKLILKNVVVDGVDMSQEGGGITVDNNATLELLTGSSITNCSVIGDSGKDGGGVYANSSSIIINGASLTNNFATKYGGGVCAENDSDVTINSGVISDNKVEDTGGGVAVLHDSVLTMNGGEVKNNMSWETLYPRDSGAYAFAGYGGGVSATYDSTFFMKGGTISGNESTYTGGGAFVGTPEEDPRTITDDSIFYMSGGLITGNDSHYAGGGVSIRGNGTIFNMTGGSITENHATKYPFSDDPNIPTGYGGGVYVISGTFNLGHDPNSSTQPIIEKNLADSQGGGVYIISYTNYNIADFGIMNMYSGRISKNTANLMGGGIAIFASTVNMSDGHIDQNTASINGGGISFYDYGDGKGSTMTMSGGSINGNSVTSNSIDGAGGGIYLYGENSLAVHEFTSLGGSISNNSSGNNGGGIYVGKHANCTLANSTTVENNNANNEGGGIYTEDFTGFAALIKSGDYSKVTSSDYANLALDDTTKFANNTAKAAYKAPTFASIMSNLKFNTSSIKQASGNYMHPLNNYDINYAYPQDGALGTYQVSYHPNGGTGAVFAIPDIMEGTGHTILNLTDSSLNYTNDGFVFLGWDTDPKAKTATYKAGDAVDESIATNGIINLYAIWKVDHYFVNYDPGTNVTNAENIPAKSPSVNTGAEYTVEGDNPAPKRLGYDFEGWLVTDDSSGKLKQIYQPKDKFTMPENNVTLTAVWGPKGPVLNKTEHLSYIVGYKDGEVKPHGKITRAESVTIIFRLLTEDSRKEYWSSESPFSDVKEGSWYNNAVSTLSNAEIAEGYEDGTFRPNEKITRAEYAALMARFDMETSTKEAVEYSDIEGHWAEADIKEVSAKGWLKGYPDGTFHPNDHISRAEVMTLINRVLDRLPEYGSDLLDDMIVWPDNTDTNQWYYLAVQEATNTHMFDRKDDGIHEKWFKLLDNPDWTKLEKDWEYQALAGNG